MSILLEIGGVLVALVAIILAYIKYMLTYWERKGFPYIEPSFPFGNLEPPHKKTKSLGQELGELYKIAKRRGYKHCGLYTISPSYLPLDLDLLKNIMTKDFEYFNDRGNYFNEKDEPISAHLFNLGGRRWKNLRARLSPSFSSGKMKYMFQTVIDIQLALEKYLEETIRPDKAVEIKSILAFYNIDIIGSCAFGIECNSFKDSSSPFTSFVRRASERGKWGQIKSAFTFSFPNLARALRIKIFPDDVKDFVRNIITDSVEYRERNNINRKDFLQLLIDLKRDDPKGDGTSLNMNEIIAQSFTFFIAGFETSSLTMTFAIYELAIRPEIQEKVRNELFEVLKKHDDKITYDSLGEMKYMRQVLDETLRMYPPFPAVTRLCVKDYPVPNTNVVLEKGIKVIIPIKGIHYDSDYYENPATFDPNRFSEENKQKRHPYAHVPFGEGPRICIGMRFALMQSQVGLACVLKNYKITLNDKTPTPLKMSSNFFVSNPKDGVWVNLEKLSK